MNFESTMVCLMVPNYLSSAIGLPENNRYYAIEPGNHHITIQYFEKFDNPYDLIRPINNANRRFDEVITTQVTGMGGFSSDYELDAVYLSIESWNLLEYREILKEELYLAGIYASDSYGIYKPHITLAYIDPMESILPITRASKVGIDFGSVFVSHPEGRVEVPILDQDITIEVSPL